MDKCETCKRLISSMADAELNERFTEWLRLEVQLFEHRERAHFGRDPKPAAPTQLDLFLGAATA